MITDTWLTPPHILKALGKFDLDPCVPESMPWKTAKRSYTKKDNGLNKDWVGRVWLNPPYSRQATKWLQKLADHGNGIALIFARTETEYFFKNVWERADALLFLKGRLYFHDHNGIKARANAGAPSVLIAYGKNNVKILKESGIEGKFLYIN